MKNALSVDWIELWKRSVTMKIDQNKPPKLKCKEKNKLKKKKNIQKLWGNFKRCGTCNWNSWKRKRKLSRWHIWSNSGQEFSKINDRYQTIDLGISLSRINIRSKQTKNTILRYACSVAQLYLTLCNPMNCIPPASSVHGIFQARVLEWGAISFYIDICVYNIHIEENQRHIENLIKSQRKEKGNHFNGHWKPCQNKMK